MKSLFLNLKQIVFRVSKAKRVFLFLDYDGTLSPIAKRPDKATLPPKTRHILTKLINNKCIVVSIVSGRMLKQVKNLIGIKGIHYAGCHGLEMEKRDETHLFPCFAKTKTQISVIKRKLEIELRSTAGWEIEDKGIILALHYRRVRGKNIEKLRAIFSDIVKPYVMRGEIAIGRGKMVLEVRPAINWDKGKYCLYLMDKLRYKDEKITPIYIGDDITDETAFKVLRRKGITVFVRGERKTSIAEYYLNSTKEVVDFLNQFI